MTGKSRAQVRTQWRLSSLLLAALLIGCGDATPPLRIGTSPWLGTEPLFLARDLGHLAPDAVQLVEFANATQNAAALQSGSVDAAAVTLDEALRIGAEDPRFRIALVFDYCNGADMLIARPDIATLEALKGKRVALDDSTLSAHVLYRALDAGGLEPGDVEISILTPDEQVAAFVAGEIDALVAYDPTAVRLAELGGRALFDTTRIPAEVSDVLLVRADLPDRQLPQLAALRRGWHLAVVHLDTAPEDAIRRMAPRLGLSAEALAQAITRTQFLDAAANASLLSGPAPPYATVAARVSATLATMRLPVPATAGAGLFDARLATDLAEP